MTGYGGQGGTIAAPDRPRHGEEMKTQTDSPFLRGVRAAADYLGVSVRTIHRWMKSNRIPYAKPGGVLLFRRDALDAAIETFTVRAVRREV